MPTKDKTKFFAFLYPTTATPQSSIGKSLLTSLFTVFLITIRLNSWKPWPYTQTKYRSWKSWLSWAICAIFSSLQAILKAIEGNISQQKLQNCCVAKKLMSHTFSAKLRVFRREFLRNHSVYWAQIFRDNWNCYALSKFRVFILLAYVNEAKSVNKDSPIRRFNLELWINNYDICSDVIHKESNMWLMSQEGHKINMV